MTVSCILKYSFSLPIKYCWQGKESPQAVLFFSSLSRFAVFHLFLFLSLSVIVKTEEWKYFKELTKTLTPLEEEMFHLKEGTLTPQVYLRPKESVHVPFKYQTFICGHTFPLQVNPGGTLSDLYSVFILTVFCSCVFKILFAPKSSIDNNTNNKCSLLFCVF